MTLACRQRPWLWAALLFCGPSPALAQAQPPTAPPPDAGSSVAAPPATTARESYPDDPRLASALVMMSRGRFDAAEVTARTVLGQGAEIDRAAAILGIALLKQKKYEEARRYLERARDSKQPFPERRHAPHFLGWCCYHLGDLESSRAAFEQHAKDVPDEPDTQFGLGLVALGEDRLDDAERLLNSSLDGFSAPPKPDAVGQARALTRLSDVAMRRGKVESAEQLLERAVKASAVQHETWSKLARVRDRLGKAKEADAARANAQRILEALGRKAADGAVPPQPDGPIAPATPPTEAPTEAPTKDAKP
jgi:tetratricopeptide (TPR) repeat protein